MAHILLQHLSSVEIELWATNMQPAKGACSVKMGDSAGWERKTHKSWGNPSAR